MRLYLKQVRVALYVQSPQIDLAFTTVPEANTIETYLNKLQDSKFSLRLGQYET